MYRKYARFNKIYYFGFRVREIRSTKFTWFPTASVFHNPTILSPTPGIDSEHQIIIIDKGELVGKGLGWEGS